MGTVKKKKLSLVYAIFPKKFALAEFISSLLDAKMIVCANVFPAIESHYVWEGKTEKSKEIPVIFKTVEAKEKLLQAAIVKIHPYDTPFIASFRPKTVNNRYLAYAIEQQLGRFK
jgi:periplasmic divalent cation tolerance protein